MFHLLKKRRTSIDIFKTDKCKVTFGLKYYNFTCKLFEAIHFIHYLVWKVCCSVFFQRDVE